ncbi:N-acetylglucosamine-6-phosphate deacetylase [Kiloniella laminariae]|uniref:N-acetylglucosamine-6-phosphate deacetylase n=1 Tax=Kiloniella laminariae TaxID=454162 RepID=A0ABT4LP69_9PROT|nr:N-acetylglucosamine-6-phosphate deacetylase [Kiloniella laminariae]MCZ4282106.1 N-acetylglucosamine-6-phosphate deacetylase [Kiloniella laminariae]
MKTALVNARVFTGDRWLDKATVTINKGIIEAVGETDLSGYNQRDLAGDMLVPGFIDIQVNGGGGVLFNDQPDIEGIRAIAQAHRRFGTTGMLPTLITDERSVMVRAISAMRQALLAGEPGVLGIHLEGPYLNPLRKGVHQENQIRLMEEDALSVITSLELGKTLVTLAPEKAASGVIRELVSKGVLVAAGHTAGEYEDFQRAFSEGLSCFTHLFNAMSPLGSREPGAVGAALDHKQSWCGLIVDGYHVHPASLRAAIRAKTPGKMLLVTDAMPTVGSREDFFELYGQKIWSREGRCITDTGVLAGADLDMASAVRNSVSLLDLTLDESLRMASLYPAEFLGLGKRYGRIEKGYEASLVQLNERIEVQESWINGRDMAADGIV